VPQGPVDEPGHLGMEHGPAQVVFAVLGDPAARVVVDRYPELGTDGPDRFVDRRPQSGQLTTRWYSGQQYSPEQAWLFSHPAGLGHGIVDVVEHDLGHSGPPAGKVTAEVGQPSVVGL